MFVRKRYVAVLLWTAACAAQTERPPLQLTLKRAVEIAISPEGSARIQLAGEALKQAQSRSAEARGALLPNIEGAVSEQSMTRNLAALGVTFNNVPIPGSTFPTFVGPFDVFD